LSPVVVGFLAAAMLAGIAALDAVTGHEVHVSIFYILPVAFVALRGSGLMVWSFCVLSAGLCMAPS